MVSALPSQLSFPMVMKARASVESCPGCRKQLFGTGKACFGILHILTFCTTSFQSACKWKAASGFRVQGSRPTPKTAFRYEKSLFCHSRHCKLLHRILPMALQTMTASGFRVQGSGLKADARNSFRVADSSLMFLRNGRVDLESGVALRAERLTLDKG